MNARPSPAALDPARPALVVVSDGSGHCDRVLALGRAAARGGAWGFVVREPNMTARDVARVTRRLADEGSTCALVVSDRVDVALGAGADGVQLGERALPVARVRAWVGGRLALGRSVHDEDGARRAVQGGADWLIFGHVFPTPSKPGLPPRGAEGLRRTVACVDRPVFAIGGIDRHRVPEVVAAGASGVAVIGAVAGAFEPEAAVRELVTALAAGGDA